eukprot:2467833-Rhodomonas_salina.1
MARKSRPFLCPLRLPRAAIVGGTACRCETVESPSILVLVAAAAALRQQAREGEEGAEGERKGRGKLRGSGRGSERGRA